MLKRTILAIIVVFIVWSVLDMVIHGILLEETYQATATAKLWRPMAEMDITLMSIVTLAYTACFVFLYSLFVSNKSVATGIKFGALFGLTAGISMGFGSYVFMPIPLSLALTWFAGTLVESIVSGALVGVIVKPEESAV